MFLGKTQIKCELTTKFDENIWPQVSCGFMLLVWVGFIFAPKSVKSKSPSGSDFTKNENTIMSSISEKTKINPRF